MASQTPWPLMPPKSTEARMEHFDPHVYTADSSTVLFKFIDAMCGDSGAASLKKEIFLQRLSGALDGVYGSDLDYIFGGIRFLSRADSEAYDHNPMTQMLTSTQWNEVAAKDAQYRSRIRDYFAAAASGNTTDGIRRIVHAAISADCQVMESWRHIDAFGISQAVGRADGIGYAAVQLTTGHQVLYVMSDGLRSYFTTTADAAAYIATLPEEERDDWQVQIRRPRSEVTVVPHKPELTVKESRLLVQMLRKVSDVDTVVSVNPQGLSVHAPIGVRAIAADSTYYQVEKMVTGTPLLDDLPAPEMLAVDLDPTERWLKANRRDLAPYGQFNISQEYGYFYLVSGGKRSPIDQVGYGTLQADGTVKPELPFEWYEQTEDYGPWTLYEKADSPDNYPGGRFGLTPAKAPALHPDRSPYQFPYTSQDDYLAKRKAEVIALGGEANELRYRLPLRKTNTAKRTYTPDLAIAFTAPTRESTVTSSWTSRKPRYLAGEQRNPSLFVRS